MIVLIVKSTESYHKGLQISIPILCSVTLKCHYWITNFFPCCNIILCWLPAWAEIWNCHPQTCKSDSTLLIRKVKLNIHSRAAFQVQTVWSSLRQNVFKLKHIFSSFLYSKNSEWVPWVDKLHKFILNFTRWRAGFSFFLLQPLYCFWFTLFISFVRKPVLVGVVYCLIFFMCHVLALIKL